MQAGGGQIKSSSLTQRGVMLDDAEPARHDRVHSGLAPGWIGDT